MTVDSLVLARVEAARLLRAGKLSRAAIAEHVGISPATLRKWIKMYHWDVALGLEEKPKRPRAAVSKRNPTTPSPSPSPSPAPAAPQLQPPPPLPSPQAPLPAAPPQPVDKAVLHAVPSRDALVSRLYAAIDRNLNLLEQRMSDDTTPSAADGERDTRALGTAIRNIEKVTELEAGTERNAGPAPRGRGREFTDEEARQIRLELAERILRLRRDIENEEGDA